MPFHISQFSIFSFHQVPITAGWTEAVWYERFCPTPLHTSNFSDLRELVTLPCATICVRQTASLYQQVFHCHSGSVVSSTGRHQTATPYMPLVRQRREQRSPAMGVRCLDHSTTTADVEDVYDSRSLQPGIQDKFPGTGRDRRHPVQWFI